MKWYRYQVIILKVAKFRAFTVGDLGCGDVGLLGENKKKYSYFIIFWIEDYSFWENDHVTSVDGVRSISGNNIESCEM